MGSTSQTLKKNKIARLLKELEATEEELMGWRRKKRNVENPGEEGRCNVEIDRLSKMEAELQKEIDDLEESMQRDANKSPVQPNDQDKVFELLCSFDFAHQTQYFDSLIQSEKSFLSFVVRGRQEWYGQEWLVNKLINHFQKENRNVHDTIFLDFGELNTNLVHFIDSLSQYLGVTYEYIREPVAKKTKLRNALQSRIATKSQFIVIRNAYPFIHSAEFADFLKVISYFHDEFNAAELEHKCIFFFVELRCSEPYQHVQHCLFSSEHAPYRARDCEEFRFIDLDVIQPVPEAEVRKWIEKTPPKIYNCFKELLKEGNQEQMKNFIADGNPQRLIPLICEKLGKKYAEYESKWRKQ